MKQTLLFFTALLLLSRPASAQCNTPTAATIATTNITCAGHGGITVTGITESGTGVPLTTCRYTLYNAANDSIIRATQDAAAFNDLDSGTYVLHISRICSPGNISLTDYTQNVHLTGYYQTPQLSSPTITTAGCNDGAISISATYGYGAYQYCLVDSLNAPLFPAHYVKPLQTGGTFSALPAGTYFVRVYDACNGFTTIQAVIPSIPTVSPFNGFVLSYNDCSSYSLRVGFNRALALNDTSNKMWISYPDGSVDSVTTAYPVGALWGRIIPFSKLGSTYPAVVNFHYTDACGDNYTMPYTFNQPSYYVYNNQTAQAYSCDTGVFYLKTPHLWDNNNNIYNDGPTNWDSVSFDNGLSWVPYNVNDSILVTNQASQTILYKRCGLVFPIVVSPPSLSTFNLSLGQAGNIHCPGNAGIQVTVYSYNGNVNKIQAEMISKPAAQASIAPFFLTFNNSNGTRPDEWANLVPGNYTFRFTDQCGDTLIKNITIVPSHDTVTVTPQFSCGASTVGLVVYNNSDQEGGSFVLCEVRDNNNNLVDTFRAYGDFDDPIDGLQPGIYHVKVWFVSPSFASGEFGPWNQYTNTSACAYEFTVDASLPGTLSLVKSAFAVCTNDPTTGMIIVNPEGGIPPYSYSLFKNGVSAGNLVAGPQSSNVFTNLETNAFYTISATDQCSGTTYGNVFSNVQPVLGTSSSLIPCPGDSILLYINNNPAFVYQWTKNDVNIAGATGPAYDIPSVVLADSGSYAVRISANNCLLLSTPTVIDPNNCGTPFPLPLDLLSFNGSVNAQQNAVLNWKTAHEERNTVFSVWYSTDGKQFSKAGTVPGNATGNTYSFTHSDYKLNSKTYYKLLLTDATGADKYSPVIVLKGTQQNNSRIEASPVPFTSGMSVTYTAANAGNITLQLTDVSGRVLKTQTAAVVTGVNSISMHNLDALPNGTYFLKATDEAGQVQALKVQK